MDAYRLEFYRSGLRRDWRWRFIAPNGKKMATSGEGYRNKEDCLVAAERVFGAEMWGGTFPDRPDIVTVWPS
jgi:uncharacterized protein YegP (UPF0339 family)